MVYPTGNPGLAKGPTPFARSATRVMLCALALIFGLGSALARDFSVYPVRIELRPERAAETVVLSHRDDRELRFEVSYQAWDMDESGAWRLSDNDELLVHPLQIAVPPQASATLRVGHLGVPDGRQRAWRLFIQQLPDEIEAETVQIQVLTRLSLPVFFGPGDAEPQAQLERARVETGELRFELGNPGAGYLGPQRLTLYLLDEAGELIGSTEVDAGYVLAGRRLPLTVPLSSETCARIRTVVVDLPEARMEASAPISEHDRACDR
jgi:P pilus assembly chaperone PapD